MSLLTSLKYGFRFNISLRKNTYLYTAEFTRYSYAVNVNIVYIKSKSLRRAYI